MRINMDKTAIILNDQLGRGRSSNTAAIVYLIERWLRLNRAHPPTTPLRQRTASRKSLIISGESRTSWQIINSALRVIRNGLEVKRVVDEAIDRTSATFNLRDAIEDFRDRAEQAHTPEEKNSYIEKGELCVCVAEALISKECTTFSATSTCWSSRRTSTTPCPTTRRHTPSSRLSSTAQCSRRCRRTCKRVASRA